MITPQLKKIFKLSLAFIMLMTMLLVTTYMLGVHYINLSGPLADTKTIVIEKGSSSWNIATQLQNEKIISNRYLFWTISIIFNKSRYFKAGEYEFKKEVKPVEIIDFLTKGLIVIHKLTIPEGLTNKAVIDLIEQQKALSGNIINTYPEGYLMPSTYFYVYGDRKQMILQKMYDEMIKFLDYEWEKRESSPYIKNKNDAIILASIIEKEAILSSEQPVIAGVFMNRLKKNMKLQADPTVEYALTMGQNKLNRLLTRKDTQLDSKYNTYYVKGLPPSPIANPGKGAIIAALHPAKHSFLYFVTSGSLHHNFSDTYEQHNRHIINYKKKIKND
jgi:UPF0755 protein